MRNYTQKPQNLKPLLLDEVSAAFIASLRVNSFESLGEKFGGYKIGKIYSYILSTLNEKISESTVATIRVDVPIYEQDSTVTAEEKVFEKCPIKHSMFYGKTTKELMGDLAEKIKHSCDYLNKNEKEKEAKN